MNDKPKLTSLYATIFTNFASLRDSGLLDPARFAEIESYLCNSQFEPAILKSGREIPDWWSHKVTGDIFNKYFMTDGKWSRNKIILEYVLNEEEIKKLNQYGNSEW
jgi:hypothetical protein